MKLALPVQHQQHFKNVGQKCGFFTQPPLALEGLALGNRLHLIAVPARKFCQIKGFVQHKIPKAR